MRDTIACLCCLDCAHGCGLTAKNFPVKNSHQKENPHSIGKVKTASKDSRTYREILVELQDARNTLAAFGYHTQGRVETYERCLRRLAEALPDRIAESFTEEEAGEAILMFPEVMEFLSLVRALSRSPHLMRHPRFKEVFSGGVLTIAEEKTTPRDVLFELTIASLLGTAGIPASIEGVADVESVFQGTPILVECKRIQSFDKLETRIGSANRQLGPRLDALGQGAIGLIALSLTKALTEGNKRLSPADEVQMNAAMAELMKRGQRNLARYWDRYTNFDGVLVHLCLAGRMKGPFVNIQFGLLVRPELSGPRLTFLQAFLETIQAAHR